MQFNESLPSWKRINCSVLKIIWLSSSYYYLVCWIDFCKPQAIKAGGIKKSMKCLLKSCWRNMSDAMYLHNVFIIACGVAVAVVSNPTKFRIVQPNIYAFVYQALTWKVMKKVYFWYRNKKTSFRKTCVTDQIFLLYKYKSTENNT